MLSVQEDDVVRARRIGFLLRVLLAAHDLPMPQR